MNEKLFRANLRLLNKYSYFYCDEKEISNYHIINKNKERKERIIKYDVIETGSTKKPIIFLKNVQDYNFIYQLERKNDKQYFIEWKKLPFYLYFDNFSLISTILGYYSLEKILQSKRIVIIIGYNRLLKFFSDYQSILPNRFIGIDIKNTVEEFINLEKKRKKVIKLSREEIQNYYKENKNKIIHKILKNDYKVLFLTTRFVEGKRDEFIYEFYINSGYRATLGIEKNDISRLYPELLINEYKPDVIFMSSHLRYDYDFLPPDVFVISWLIDYFGCIKDKKTVSLLTHKDILINPNINDLTLQRNYGYPKDMIIDSFYPGNYKVYKPNPNEKKYDVCFIANNIDVQSLFLTYQLTWQDDVRHFMKQIISEAYSLEYNGEYIWPGEYMRNYFMEHWNRHMHDDHYKNEELINIQQHFASLMYRLKKYVLGLWLKEFGIDKLVFGGLDWKNIKEFKKYSIGYVEAGDELSHIYNSSKIAIGTHPHMTLSTRTTEIIYCKSLNLVQYIPKQYDVCPLTSYIPEELITWYKDKNDLFKKLEYYLTKNKEREEKVDKIYNTALKYLSYDKFVMQIRGVLSKRAKFIQQQDYQN